MKISKARLKTIILEELQNVMGEMDMLPMGSEDGMDSEKVKLTINDEEYETDMDFDEVNDIITQIENPPQGKNFSPIYSVERDQEGVDFVIDMSRSSDGAYVQDLLGRIGATDA